MRKLMFLSLIIASIFACTHRVQPLSVLDDKNLPDTPAAIRALELIRIINLNQEEELKAYVQKNVASTIPIAEQVQDFLSDFHRSRGLIFYKVERLVDFDEASFIVINQLTKMKERFYVKVSKNPPYQIIDSSLGDIIIDIEKPITKTQAALELKNLLARLSQADAFSGAVLLAQNSKIIFQGAYGDANKDFRVRNNLETKFNLGSINKMFTAIAIAQLVEQNKLSFDDSLSKFMPNFPDKLSAQKIKISHLLSHTSGLGHYMNAQYWASSRTLFKTIDDCLEIAKDEKISFEPGSKYRYSNTGYLLLGKIIEIITSTNYFDYINDKIFKPINMSHSGYFDLSLVNYNLAVGYERIYTSYGYYYKNNLFDYVIKGGPGGGGYSTVNDLLKFALALATGKLVSLKTLDQMTSLESAFHYGYGMKVESFKNGKIIGHVGGFTGISDVLSIHINNGYIAIVLGNYGQKSARPIEYKMKELIGRMPR